MKNKNLLYSLLCFVGYTLLVWQRYDMYIGKVLTAVINGVHIYSGGLFALILYGFRSKTIVQDDVGMYCCLLFFAALGNGIFTAMSWGAWLGLPVSALLMIFLFSQRRKFPE